MSNELQTLKAECEKIQKRIAELEKAGDQLISRAMLGSVLTGCLEATMDGSILHYGETGTAVARGLSVRTIHAEVVSRKRPVRYEIKITECP